MCIVFLTRARVASGGSSSSFAVLATAAAVVVVAAVAAFVVAAVLELVLGVEVGLVLVDEAPAARAVRTIEGGSQQLRIFGCRRASRGRCVSYESGSWATSAWWHVLASARKRAGVRRAE